MVISQTNHGEEAKRLADGFQVMLERLCAIPCRVIHAQLAGGTFRRFEVAIAGLPVFPVEFNATDCAAATRTGWATAFLLKLATVGARHEPR
jgi:hypothetical protein